jgi:hypothetical protein
VKVIQVSIPPVTGGGSSAAVLLGWAFCLTTWLLLSSVAAIGAPAQPITDVGVDVTFDFDGDGNPDCDYEHIADNAPQPPRDAYYTVSFFLRNTAHVRFVRFSKQRIDFALEDTVSPTSQAYLGPGGGQRGNPPRLRC